MMKLNVIWIQLLMPPHMYLQRFALREALFTMLTLKRFLARMCHQMTKQNFLLRKGSVANIATERFLTYR
jgi:hypothetical protein